MQASFGFCLGALVVDIGEQEVDTSFGQVGTPWEVDKVHVGILLVLRVLLFLLAMVVSESALVVAVVASVRMQVFP